MFYQQWQGLMLSYRNREVLALIALRGTQAFQSRFSWHPILLSNPHGDAFHRYDFKIK